MGRGVAEGCIDRNLSHKQVGRTLRRILSMRVHDLKSQVLSLILVVLSAVCIPCHSEPFFSGLTTEQSRTSYEAAIRNQSTSPSYVLISVADSETGQLKRFCTTANFLLGAIHHEYGLGYGPADVSKAMEIALGSQNHVFRFHEKAALNNIRATYSEDDLATAAALLAPLSTEELRTKFSSLYKASRLQTDGYGRDAVACILIGRGLSPKLSDISGQVYIDSMIGNVSPSVMGQ